METIHKQKPVSKREFYLALGGFVLGTGLGIMFFSYFMPDMTMEFAKRKSKGEGLIETPSSTSYSMNMEMRSAPRTEKLLAPTLRDVIALNETATQIARSVLETNPSPEVKDLAQTIIENRERENKLLEGVK